MGGGSKKGDKTDHPFTRSSLHSAGEMDNAEMTTCDPLHSIYEDTLTAILSVTNKRFDDLQMSL